MKRKLFLLLCALLTSVGMWAQKDVTSTYITNATLSDGTNGWTKTHTKTEQTSDPADAFSNSVRGNNTVGYATEAYAGWGSLIQTAYSMKQTITLPAGNYRLVCYAFFRQGAAYNTNSSKSLAKLKAGANEVSIKTLGSITATYYANSQAEGANCFDSKMYRNVVEFTSDGSPIEIGIEGTFDEAKSWCIVGQFELFDLDDLASVESPTDMTYAITNSGFEYRDLSGWTNNPDGAFWFPTEGNINNFEHNGYGWVEKWSGGTFPNVSLSQTLTGLPNGLYEVTVLAQARGGNGFYVFANDEKTQITTRGDYSVRATITDGNLTLGVKTVSFQGDWTPVDNFRLKFYGDPMAAYQALLDAAVAGAQALIDGAAGDAISATAKAAWQQVVDDNDNDDHAFTEESQFTTAIENIENANTNFQAMAAPYAKFNALKAAANNIAGVAYTETVSGSHTTFTTAISTQTAAADAATTAAAINTATSALTAAIKTYIAGAEPANDGESFEITCLVTNPKFADNTITGWTRSYSGGNAQTTYGCNEFWNNTFDFYQNLVELPNGSYQLSVQAFCRPGENGNLTDNKKAYYDYTQGANNVTAELYVNSDASRVGNIYGYKDATSPKHNPGTWENDYECEVDGGTNYYVPNCMEGASKYFADEDVYKTTVAALVDDNTLKIGFRDESLTSAQWTIFTNFRLYYYGSSKLVYYQQYLPQLKDEANADLGNAAYENVTGKERTDLVTAVAATPAAETEEAYKAVIDDIVEKQAAFTGAKSSYDALVAAQASSLAKISANIGTGVFQYNETTNNTLYSAYELCKAAVDGYTVTVSTTASVVQALVDALDDAIDEYNNQALNAPDAGKRYCIVVATEEHAQIGKAFGIKLGETSDNNPTGYTLSTSNTTNQSVAFTQVSGNRYNISFETSEGTTYMTYGTTNGSAADWSDSQIQATTDDQKMGEFVIIATSTENVFNIQNTLTNTTIACQSGGNIYTEPGNADFTLVEATEVNLKVTDGKLGTFIAPFDIKLPAGVKAYSATSNETTVTLTKIAEGGDDLDAGTPVIVYGDGVSVDETLYGAPTIEENQKVGALVGILDESDLTVPVGAYVLQTQGGNQAFYKLGEDATGALNRCYVEAGSGEARLVISLDDATIINAIEAAEAEAEGLKDGKFLIEGKIVIVKNGVKYSANGQKLN